MTLGKVSPSSSTKHGPCLLPSERGTFASEGAKQALLSSALGLGGGGVQAQAGGSPGTAMSTDHQPRFRPDASRLMMSFILQPLLQG